MLLDLSQGPHRGQDPRLAQPEAVPDAPPTHYFPTQLEGREAIYARVMQRIADGRAEAEKAALLAEIYLNDENFLPIPLGQIHREGMALSARFELAGNYWPSRQQGIRYSPALFPLPEGHWESDARCGMRDAQEDLQEDLQEELQEEQGLQARASEIAHRASEPSASELAHPTSGSLFTLRTARQVLEEAAARPQLRPLWGTLLQEGELAILFADTGVGKTVLAVQMAADLAHGRPVVVGEASTAEPAGRRVVYVDFELSDAMFAARYQQGAAGFFADGFLRAHIDVAATICAQEAAERRKLTGEPLVRFEREVFLDLEHVVERNGAEVLVVDNITALSLKSTADADAALSLMRALRQLQQMRAEEGHPLSILILAHTPKIAPGQAMTLSQLGGSKHLANFADSIFCLARSAQGEAVRYLKQLKCRNASARYEGAAVLGLRLSDEGGVPRFMPCGEPEPEAAHLPESEQRRGRPSSIGPDTLELARQRLAAGLTQKAVAEQLGLSRTALSRALQGG